MKTLIRLMAVTALAGTAALAGCVAVPVEPGPAVYAAPPLVVVAPAFGYYYSGGPYWHRGWR